MFVKQTRALSRRPLRSSVIASLVALTACASLTQKAQPAIGASGSADACIRVENLAEWEPLDDRTLLLSMPGKPRGHLVTLATPIEDLQLAGDIEIIDGDRDGFICAGGADGVFAADCGCVAAIVASIEYLSEKRTAELLGTAPNIL